MSESLEYIYLDSKGRCPYSDSESWKVKQGERKELLSFLEAEKESGAYILAYLTVNGIEEVLLDRRVGYLPPCSLPPRSSRS